MQNLQKLLINTFLLHTFGLKYILPILLITYCEINSRIRLHLQVQTFVGIINFQTTLCPLMNWRRMYFGIFMQNFQKLLINTFLLHTFVLKYILPILLITYCEINSRVRLHLQVQTFVGIINFQTTLYPLLNWRRTLGFSCKIFKNFSLTLSYCILLS